MPECDNCGHWVTEQYVRVYAPRGRDTVRCCPRCEDRVRRGSDVREARGTRRIEGFSAMGMAEDDLATDGGQE